MLVKSTATIAKTFVVAADVWTTELVSVTGKRVWSSVESVEDIIPTLDKGADIAVVSPKAIQDLETLSTLPKDRLALDLGTDVDISLAQHFTLFITEKPAVYEQLKQFGTPYLVSKNPEPEFVKNGGQACWVVDESLPLEQVVQQFTDLVLSRVHSDRPDGLFTTMVVDEQSVALGLCYSNKESVAHAILKKSGVYWSRNRGLWHKGLTSGATQELLDISIDCDSDTLRFSVVQEAPGFCHLNTRTCFGESHGISGLYQVLKNRLTNAPEGSYTQRLFKDKQLLHSKIQEEAKELCEATDKEEIAWEAADVLYFALTKCVASGVSLTDVERHLNMRSKKVTRRPGNAKDVVEKPRAPEFNMEVHIKDQISQDQAKKLLQRPILKTAEIMNRVKPIVKQVVDGGDKALLELTAKFDRVTLDTPVIKAPFPAELMQISAKVKESIDLAYENILKFHQAQLDTEPLVVETMPGVKCTRFIRPIERVGLYVPGGTAILPSTTLMLGIPAKVAGCKEIVIASPPQASGHVAPEVVYVAHKIGATTILKAGGAQAVAAMAYGTETVPKVDKICGPGNQYVTAAKMIAQSDSTALVSIDMPAGPSELLVVAESKSNFSYVASDLLSQAEHGVDSQVVLVAVGFTSNDLERFQAELKKQAMALPRSEIVKVSLSKSFVLCVDTIQEALQFSNEYAPEHLILNVDDAESLLDGITSAGSVFVGPFSPESCGDYASGTNHTLPTYGYSRMYSGVNTHTFVKHITSQTLTEKGLDAIGDCVMTLAHLEGLEAHRNAVAVRIKDIREL